MGILGGSYFKQHVGNNIDIFVQLLYFVVLAAVNGEYYSQVMRQSIRNVNIPPSPRAFDCAFEPDVIRPRVFSAFAGFDGFTR